MASFPGSADYAVAQSAPVTFTISTPLTVTAMNQTTTGFTMQFSNILDTSQLNLYDLGGTWGPADVVLTGSATGGVNGSLVMSSAGDGFTFIKTGGVLAPDTYTVTLRSAANGFKDTTGLLLDGSDGIAGDNYTWTFAVAAPPSNAVTVSLPDFARGYGQPVNVPATGTGLPLTISSGQNVGSLSLTLDYDPSLLTISGFAPTTGLSATLDTSTPGVAILTVTSTSQFSSTSGLFTVGTFSAQVPNTATYGAKEVLHFASLQVKDTSSNVLPSLPSDAIHLAAYFGDTSGDGSYNSPDTTLVRRLIGQVQTGLVAYPLADPMLVAHVSPSGSIGSTDTTRIRRVIGQIPVAEIPSLPVGLTPPATADPEVYIPTNLTGHPGDTITVPVKLDVTDPGGITVSGAQIVILFDASKFTVTGAQLGGLITGSDQVGSLLQPAAGTLIYEIDNVTSTTSLAQGTVGDLLTLTVTIAGNATNGPSPINLVPSYGSTETALYDASLNALTLNPVPTSASNDPIDGVVTISTVVPTSTITFPTAASYNVAGWGTGTIQGTSSETGGPGVSSVQVNIENTTTGKWYDGSGFNASTVQWLTATGTTTWTYPLAASKLTDGSSYTVSSQATDTVGKTQSIPATASFIYDTTAPTIAPSAPSGTITTGGPITYTVTYADANFNSSTLARANITLNKTGTANGTLGVSGTGLTRTVTISGITGDGSLGISIVAGTASDLAGNLAPAAGPTTTFIVDNTPPTIAIGSPSGTITKGGPITYTVTYADANFNSSTLAAANITLNKTGTANGTLGVSGTGLTRTVTISGITGDGSLGISIAAGTASDLAGNLAPSAGPSTTFIVDNTAPTILIGSPSASYAAGGPITYTVTYADANFNSSTLAGANITLNKTGTANGTLGVSGTGLTRTVTISGITGDGSLGISIVAGTASDLAGNLAPAAGPSTTFMWTTRGRPLPSARPPARSRRAGRSRTR